VKKKDEALLKKLLDTSKSDSCMHDWQWPVEGYSTCKHCGKKVFGGGFS